MKKLLYLSFCGILLMLVISLVGHFTTEGPSGQRSTTIKNPQGPDIYFKEKVFDFGEVDEGEKVAHSFKFKNRGDALLKIKKVGSTCGCIAALGTKKELEPGESGEIKAVFNSQNYMGWVRKVIYVQSNDPDESTVALHITGKVLVDIGVNPRRVDFGQVQVGEPHQKKIELFPMKLKGLEVEKVESSVPYLTTRQEEKNIEGKPGVELTVLLTPDASLGRLSESLKIHTNSKKQSVISIPIIGTIRGGVWTSPEELVFGCHRGHKRTLELTVNIGERKGFKLLKAKDELGYVTAEISLFKEEQLHQVYQIEVQVKPDAPVGSLMEKLHLYTNDKEHPMLDVSLQGFIH